MWPDDRSDYERGVEDGLEGDGFTDFMDDGARAVGGIWGDIESKEYLRGVEKGRDIRGERETAARASAKEQASSSGDYYCSGGSYESSRSPSDWGDWLLVKAAIGLLLLVSLALAGNVSCFLLFLIGLGWLVIKAPREIPRK